MAQTATTKKPDFDRITRSDLERPETLQELYIEAVRRGFWSNNERAVLEFFSFAEKALSEDKYGTPGKLFYSLIKKKDHSMLTDKHEKRAGEKINSYHRSALVDAANDLNNLTATSTEEEHHALVGRDIGYNHGIMVQCFLPHHEPPAGTTSHQFDHGRASLLVKSGELADPERPNHFKQCAIPWGSKPRLIIPYINFQAVCNRSPVIDLGDSLSKFLKKIKISKGGPNGNRVSDQIENIAASQFTLGEWNADGSAKTKFAKVAKEIDFWIERDDNQMTLWQREMILSNDYLDAILERSVPIDMNHIAQLQRSVTCMDLYNWLSYRTPQIPISTPLRLRLPVIHKLFAPDIDLCFHDLFKQRLKCHLKKIYGVYSGFNIEIEKSTLLLRNSKPPVPQRQTPRLIA